VLTSSEQAALAVFKSFMVSTGEMLCFQGPQLEKHGATLRQMAEKNLVVKESFAGGYSLTPAGFKAMTAPQPARDHSPAAKPSAASQTASRR
jgi:hypothetical protein